MIRKVMLSKEEISVMKKEARGFIEFMESAGDNANFVKILLTYIEQLESNQEELKIQIEKALLEIQDIDLMNIMYKKSNQKKAQKVYNILFD